MKTKQIEYTIRFQSENPTQAQTIDISVISPSIEEAIKKAERVLNSLGARKEILSVILAGVSSEVISTKLNEQTAVILVSV